MGRRPDRTTNRATDRYGEGGREATLVVLLVIGGVFVVLGVGQSSGAPVMAGGSSPGIGHWLRGDPLDRVDILAVSAPRTGQLVIALGFVLAAAACSSPQSSSAAPTSSAVPAAASQAAEPIRVFSHCGIRWVQWKGRSWVAENPQPAPMPVPDSRGIVTVDGYTEGAITKVSPARADFTADGLAEPVRFVPGAAPAPCA